MANENNNKEDNKDWTDRAKNLGAEKIIESIYKDGLQVPVKTLGKGLTTVAEAVNVALAPIKGIVWSYQQIELLLNKKLNKKLHNVPPQNIKPPPIHIAGPTIEALRFSKEQPELQDMFSSLLANSMIENKKNEVHPAFISVIKQLSPEEAKILKILSLKRISSLSHGFKFKSVVFQFDKLVSIDPTNHVVTTKHLPEQLAFNAIFEKFKDFFDLKSQMETRLLLQPITSTSLSNLIRLEILSVHCVVSEDQMDNYGNYNEKIMKSILYITEFGTSFIRCCVS